MKDKYKTLMTGLVISFASTESRAISSDISVEKRVDNVRKSIANKIDKMPEIQYKLDFKNGVASKLSNEEQNLLTWVNWGNGWNNWVDWSDWNDWNNWGDWVDWNDFSNFNRWSNW